MRVSMIIWSRSTLLGCFRLEDWDVYIGWMFSGILLLSSDMLLKRISYGNLWVE